MSYTIPSVDISSLEAEIASQTTKFNELRLSGQPLDEIKKSLSDLKKTLALARNAGKVKDKEKKTEESKKKDLLLLKTAKVC
jgi:histidyl-tRNA synthetase